MAFRLFKLFGAAVLVAALSPLATAQNPWQAADRAGVIGAGESSAANWLSQFAAFKLDAQLLKGQLDQAPMEPEDGGMLLAKVITLPMPDGSFQRFKVVNSPIIKGQAKVQLPNIETYSAQGLDDPAAVARLDLGPNGFHGYVLGSNGDFFIEPLVQGDMERYISSYRRDNLAPRQFACYGPLPAPKFKGIDFFPTTLNGLKTYRLAMSTTAEYTNFFGGTESAGNAVVTAVNAVTLVYERDLGIRLNLTFTKCWTSIGFPFSNNPSGAELNANQTALDTTGAPYNGPGNANYDIGHVFGTGGGGIAQLQCVGVTGAKAKGSTGLPNPQGSVFYIDYVAHEMGHQYGSNHTFNTGVAGCVGQRSASNAYEIGSGSTIMAYAGICSPENVQNVSDPNFHTRSWDVIRAWRANAGSGGVFTNTTNNDPTVSAGADYTIPPSTAFKLRATGSDPDAGDALTYSWEEFDLGNASPPLSDDAASARPIWRSKPGVSSNTRFVPPLANVLANTWPTYELPATFSRTRQWRCTIRDNKANGGGSAWDQMALTIAGTQFSVTSPNTAVTWPGGSVQTVTWNVGGTAGTSPNVRILLSTNGGSSYETGGTILLATTANDGSHAVTIPTGIPTTTARIFVESFESVFYDVSNTNFTITNPTNVTFTPDSYTLLEGTLFAGALADVFTSNDQYLVAKLDKWGRNQPVIVQFDGTSSILTGSRIDIAVEAHASQANTVQRIHAWDWVNGAWVLIDTATVGLADVVRSVSITSNVNNFLQSGTGKVRMKVDQDIVTRSIRIYLDQVFWKVFQ